MPAEFRSDVQNGLITLIAEGDPSYKAIPNVSGPIPAGHLVVGTIGANFVFDVLTEIGADDLALDLLLTDTYPSYGLMVASDVDAPPRRGTEFPQRGSSSLWEQWEGQSSRNHIMGASLARTVTRAASQAQIEYFRHAILRICDSKCERQ